MHLEEIIKKALAEDIGEGDHTTLATIPSGRTGTARLLVREDGILCGMPVAKAVFSAVDPSLVMRTFLSDGSLIRPGMVAFDVEGPMGSILQSERLVLNFMQRLSGIATQTRMIVNLLEGLHTRVLDTRKTTPGLRELEKYAVVTGGAGNHRMGLFDMILIKDNHVDISGGIVPAIDRAGAYLQRTGKKLKVEIEVRNMTELEAVMEHGGVDRIMLDNFSPEILREAIARVAGRFETEASGGITQENIRSYADTGVDFISVGALTHHIKSLDLSLKVAPGRKKG